MLETSDRDGVRIFSIRRPPVNALELALLGELEAALQEVRADPSCRALVLTGSPGIFSAGLDTRVVPAYDRERRCALLRQVNRLVLGLYGTPLPTVAAISGHALAAGFVLALLCDLRLAARGGFRLGLPEVDAGIPFPAGPLAVVKAELPAPLLRSLGLGGHGLPEDAAELTGIVDRVVEPAELLDAAVAWARERAATPAYARVKRQLRAETLLELEHIVEADAEPLLEDWI